MAGKTHGPSLPARPGKGAPSLSKQPSVGSALSSAGPKRPLEQPPAAASSPPAPPQLYHDPILPGRSAKRQKQAEAQAREASAGQHLQACPQVAVQLPPALC